MFSAFMAMLNAAEYNAFQVIMKTVTHSSEHITMLTRSMRAFAMLQEHSVESCRLAHRPCLRSTCSAHSDAHSIRVMLSLPSLQENALRKHLRYHDETCHFLFVAFTTTTMNV